MEWFNVSEELSLAQHLKGKIVLLDFFTYCCINCMHVLAELEEIEKKISIENGLVVVNILFYMRKILCKLNYNNCLISNFPILDWNSQCKVYK